MKPERLLYLGYHFKKADYAKLAKFRRYVFEKYDISPSAQWRDALSASLRYNVSFDDYYLFGFYKLNPDEREAWAGTGTMYEYQKVMNPPGSRSVLEDKQQFYQIYAPFIRHRFESLEALKENPSKAKELLQSSGSKIVLKHSAGQCGNGIEVRETKEFTPETLVQRLEQTGNDMAEEFVQQHEALNLLSPSGLNTVRIITQLDEHGKVHILGARLRITVNSSVDNLAAGNIAAPIVAETGIVNGPGVYSDITKGDETNHPVTGTDIIGFQIPYWSESVELVKQAALHDTGNRSIGWDVAVTNSGPDLIEGNHDWCKLLWQLPVKRGMKSELVRFL